jgi:hypothetical protein
MSHPVQIFLHNPQALRVEYRFDDCRLILWWSPLAGCSFAARDRNFSNRDDHLDVFDRIVIPGCDVAAFTGCDYDPYHTVLHFKHQTLHLALRHDAPVLLLWTEKPQVIDFKSTRYDGAKGCAKSWVILHKEASHDFEFAAMLGDGEGSFRHSPVHAEWNSRYAQACLSAGQRLAMGAGLAGERIAARCRPDDPITTDEALVTHEQAGRISAPSQPEMEQLRRIIVRGLHSMIDESAAFRASLKPIYYLIWVRDAAFAFTCMEAAGWPHKLAELCRLYLSNPTVARGDEVPAGRMFGQLIHPDYGKYEEDGFYYVIHTIFTHWTHTGSREFLEGENLALLKEALDWVEHRCFREESGMYEGFFADETPALGSRDEGWDFAIGMPAGGDLIRHDGKPIVRSRDIYLNTLMHSAHSMMAAALGDQEHATKAAALWEKLRRFHDDRRDGLPPYGELLDENGKWHRVAHFGPVSSVYVWALTLPDFLPLDERDALMGHLLDELSAHPAMHWINGICAAIAATDPWVHGEQRMLDLLLRIKDEAMRPGQYLPMAGAMPEKFNAPKGSLHSDIRPQGFAMAAWLAAWASLGVRRLPFGLAVRPTRAFHMLEHFAWQGGHIDFSFEADISVLTVNGRTFPATLQLPENALTRGKNSVMVPLEMEKQCLLRSTVKLLHCDSNAIGECLFEFESFGDAEMVFSAPPAGYHLSAPMEIQSREESSGLFLLRFRHFGRLDLRITW